MNYPSSALTLASTADPRLFSTLLPLALLASVLSACHSNDPRLVIVARSDLAPHEEVDRIDVELVGIGSPTSTTISRSSSLREGLTVYERQLATLHARHLRVRFFSEEEEIARRDLVFDHLVDREIVVDVPRLCVDAGCGEEETCVLGQCAAPTCVDGTESDCPEPMCGDDAECAVEGIPCARGACGGGVCLALGDDDACSAGEWCDPLNGCAPRRVAVDASTGDAAAAVDAGGDAGIDAEIDAGIDAEIDAGSDASSDASSEETVDAGADVDTGMLAI